MFRNICDLKLISKKLDFFDNHDEKVILNINTFIYESKKKNKPTKLAILLTLCNGNI